MDIFNNGQKPSVSTAQKPVEQKPSVSTAQKPVEQKPSVSTDEKKKPLTVEEKKKEIKARKDKIAAQIKDKRTALRNLERAEKELDNPKQSRKDRTRALCCLAGLILEDMKKNKDVAGIQKYYARISNEADKRKFQFLINEVSGK